jgi:hypothetical protein
LKHYLLFYDVGEDYVTNGLVVRWRVREWTTVAGEAVTNPVRP